MWTKIVEVQNGILGQPVSSQNIAKDKIKIQLHTPEMLKNRQR